MTIILLWVMGAYYHNILHFVLVMRVHTHCCFLFLFKQQCEMQILIIYNTLCFETPLLCVRFSLYMHLVAGMKKDDYVPVTPRRLNKTHYDCSYTIKCNVIRVTGCI